jgi:hypothetical protein
MLKRGVTSTISTATSLLIVRAATPSREGLLVLRCGSLGASMIRSMRLGLEAATAIMRMIVHRWCTWHHSIVVLVSRIIITLANTLRLISIIWILLMRCKVRIDIDAYMYIAWRLMNWLLLVWYVLIVVHTISRRRVLWNKCLILLFIFIASLLR